ncbi:MAG: recombinase family protein [Candidatus Sedimenticola sp. (ex Thyasira tokunagai)]
MNIGYSRISKPNGAQCDDLQHDALIAAGVLKENIYSDSVSGRKEKRPGLDSCLKALREGDTLLVWKLDRLGSAVFPLALAPEEKQSRHPRIASIHFGSVRNTRLMLSGLNP